MEYTYSYQSTKPDHLNMALRELEYACIQNRTKMTPILTTFTLEGTQLHCHMELKVFSKTESMLLKMDEIYSHNDDKTRGTTTITIYTDEGMQPFMNTFDFALEHAVNECNRVYQSMYFWENPSYHEYDEIRYPDNVSNRAV